eukprot:6302111-Pyramimonas_sp.AAC.1
MPPRDLGYDDSISLVVEIVRDFFDVHFGPQSSGAKLSVENGMTLLWHVRLGGNPPEGAGAFADEEGQYLREDVATWAK